MMKNISELPRRDGEVPQKARIRKCPNQGPLARVADRGKFVHSRPDGVVDFSNGFPATDSKIVEAALLTDTVERDRLKR